MDTKALHEKSSYLAGYFDGEGCIFINYSPYSLAYKVLCTISSKDKAVLNIFYNTYGGKLYGYEDRKIVSGIFYQWRLMSSKVAPFLNDILPHLILKKSQALVALRFQESMTNRSRSMHTRKLSAEEITAREADIILMKNLKKEVVI